MRGADFTNDPALSDRARLPICENITPDAASYPEKRVGWRRLESFEDKIYGLHGYTSDGVHKLIVHSGNKLICGGVTLCETMEREVSRSFQDGDKLIILDGKSYTVYDGESVKQVNDADGVTAFKSGLDETDNGAYIPTTSIAAYPMEHYNSYTASNGAAYESVNLLTPWRKMTASGSDSNMGCILPLDCCPDRERGELYYTTSTGELFFKLPSVRVFVNGEEKTVLINRTDNSSYRKSDMDVANLRDCLFLLYKGTNDTRFNTILPKDEKNCWLYFRPLEVGGESNVPGRDNIEIYCRVTSDKGQDVTRCRVLSEYQNCLFVTGNPDKPNYDWHSEPEKPLYFPDLSYQKFGDATPIAGYLSSASEQAVVKYDASRGGSIYLRSSSGEYFPVRQLKSGVGALSRDGFASFMGDDLMLTSEGIAAVVTQSMTGDKALVPRSLYIDKRLLSEADLENAVMAVHDGKCICFTGTAAYVLNGKSSKSGGQYDCYYWTGIPAQRVLSLGGTLYFSSECDLCRFSDDLEAPEKFSDDGRAIIARFGTRFDDDGDPTRWKSMIKRGCSVSVRPYDRSSINILLRTERHSEKLVKTGFADIFSWEDIDFSRVSFDATHDLREVYLGTKVKKYKRLQFIVKNDKLGEGLCVTGIDKHYAFGNFIKR